MDFKSIAQKIVDATMEIIDYRNINIMDKNGFIVASGDKNRIDTFHKGADDVIKSNNVVEIYPEEVEKYPGTKEGVNMPINIQGKILGVVGVYGHPDSVRMVAKLVKTSVELAFEQHLISEQITLVKDLKQQIIRKIIYEDFKENEEEVLCLFNVAGIKSNVNRISIILEIANNDRLDSGEHFTILRKLGQYICDSGFIENQDIADVINERFVIFKTIPIAGYKDIKEYMEAMQKRIYENVGINVRISCGSYYTGIDGLRRSHDEARYILKGTKENIQDINDIKVQTTFLLNQIDKSILEHFIKKIYNNILNDKGNVEPWIINTLNAMFENDLDINEASKQLYLHKNSLLYRIRKIEKLTGLSLTKSINHGILLKLLTIYVNEINR